MKIALVVFLVEPSIMELHQRNWFSGIVHIFQSTRPEDAVCINSDTALQTGWKAKLFSTDISRTRNCWHQWNKQLSPYHKRLLAHWQNLYTTSQHVRFL